MPKRKRETNFIVKIIQKYRYEKSWLVEWNDKTRTWEKYEKISMLINYITPSYIC